MSTPTSQTVTTGGDASHIPLHRPLNGYGWNVTKRNPGALFIGISGIIGAGKSTLSDKLAKKLNIPIAAEAVEENPYLGDFYKDMKKYAFVMQVHLLNERFHQHQSIIWNSPKGHIQDRTIYEDPIFAALLYKTKIMGERDYTTYLNLFQNMLSFLRKPDVILYLDVSAQTAMDRIEQRDERARRREERGPGCPGNIWRL